MYVIIPAHDPGPQTCGRIFRQASETDSRTISQGLKGLLVIPPVGDIKTMKSYVGLYRLRIGTIRILFEINHDEKVVYIRAINSRGGD